MDNKEYIIGIDIGSSNVVMAAGERTKDGEISVLGVEIQAVEGCVKNGDIVNYIELGNTIAKAKAALEQDLGLRINSSYIGVSGKSVYCVRYEDYVEINNQTGCVTENELRELNSRIEMVISGGGDEIVERTPLRYCIDDHQEVKNPLGSFGRKLSATYLFVLISRQQLDMINRALYRAEIKTSGLCVSPTLLPRLLLSETEREEGAVIVDIGGDLTDISVVYNQKLWHFSSLPIGASSINNDMREFLRIPIKDIDQLKRKYGSAVAESVPENVTVPVKTASQAKKQILQRNIAQIIEERLKDIAGFVARELKSWKFANKVPCGVVLTGGSAYLDNIDELFARELNMEVRLGHMMNGLDYDSQQKVSAFPQAVAMGLLLYGAQHSVCETMPSLSQILINNKHKREETKPEQPNGLDFTGGQNGGELPVETVEVDCRLPYSPSTPEETEIVSPSQRDNVDIEKPVGGVENHPIEVEGGADSVDNSEKTDAPEKADNENIGQERQNAGESKPQKQSLSERIRGFAERFRNKVDGMFTDDYI